MDYDTHFISEAYLKSFLGLDLPTLKRKLSDIKGAKDSGQLIFYFTKRLLDLHLFFKEDQDIREFLIYASLEWSARDQKKLMKPKKYSEDSDIREDKLIVKFKKSFICALIKKHNLVGEELSSSTTKTIVFNYDLSHFLSFVNAMECHR